MDNVDTMYEVDNGSPLPTNHSSDGVNVPSVNLDLSPEIITRLRQQVDPLSLSPNHGIDLYEQALSILST